MGGTTCTGLLAALVTGKVNGLQIALCHVCFNIFGILACYPIPYLRSVPLGMARSLGVIAGLLKWFPVFYIITVFVLIPLLFIGICNLFEAGVVGIVFGILLCIIILVAVVAAIYWINYMDGKRYLMKTFVPVDVLARYDARCEKLAAQEAEMKSE